MNATFKMQNYSNYLNLEQQLSMDEIFYVFIAFIGSSLLQ
jgi:hypothetical protein